MTSNLKALIDWHNEQEKANQQTNLQQMVYEQSKLIQQLTQEVQGLREDLRYERIERRGI
jgi:hypothetical protein|nr:MAG TPA: Protein of unknown function (DUF2746) [Caudoviricetes sp.]DAX81144.1 MAG TPA: Protein of unknown function (DUF2746) [Caudoviricetes sp.]